MSAKDNGKQFPDVLHKSRRKLQRAQRCGLEGTGSFLKYHTKWLILLLTFSLFILFKFCHVQFRNAD